MKKKLLALDSNVLQRIAKDFGINRPTKEQIATDLAIYFRSYNLLWSDVASRYQLPI